MQGPMLMLFVGPQICVKRMITPDLTLGIAHHGVNVVFGSDLTDNAAGEIRPPIKYSVSIQKP